MIEQQERFDNNEGQGGFEKGEYDKEAYHPTETNWTRQSKYRIPDKPNTIWTVNTENAYIDETIAKASFVIDRNKNILISDCDNNIGGSHQGRVLQISCCGGKKEIFINDMRLKTPVIGKGGFLYLTTSGSSGSSGHRLFCLYPDGGVKWEFIINNPPTSKPVIDDSDNIYVFTYLNRVGTLFSINKNGTLNWEYKFYSINWYEPIISKDGVIYIGLNVDKTLCAISKNGQKLWERELGQGLGIYPLCIKNDGTIYACLSSTLFALNSDGSIQWKYVPKDGNVVTSPAISADGNLYLNISAPRLVALSSEGKEIWQTKLNGFAQVPPIIGACNGILQQSFIQQKSWVEAYSSDGKKVWSYELNGTVISAVLADDDLIFTLSNCHKYSKKRWLNKMNVKWELHAIGG